MKLSMWMIANRLSALDPELHIEDDAPVCLRSARMAYATDCVHVYQLNSDAVCQGIGGKIILKDMDCQQAFEITQSIFDIYDDWISSLPPITGPEDYQRIVDDSWLIFHNPIIFLDGDNKVLALSSQYAEDDINSEWKHLCQYGYSSLNYIRKFRRTYSRNDFYIKNKAQLFQFGPDLENSISLSIAIYYDNLFCGRINILEFERTLNQGDKQILELLAGILAPHLGAMRYRQNQASHQNIFQDLILNRKIPDASMEERLLWQTGYLKWSPDDLFQLFTIHHTDYSFSSDLFILAGNQIRKLLPQVSVFAMENHIVLIYDCNITSFECIHSTLSGYLSANHFIVGISLPFRQLKKVRYFYKQALAAIHYERKESEKSLYYRFYFCAISYIIETSGREELLCACHPDILALYEKDQEHGGDRIQTLRTYLDYDRSLLNTAKALYIHRNTLVYRLNKMMDSMYYDMDDVYCRDYMKITFRILQLLDPE